MNIDERRRKQQCLSHKYRDMKRTGYPVTFETFADLWNWALENGWDCGKRIARIDKDGPWSEDNCFIFQTSLKEEYQQMLISKWNKMVEPIRERYKDELAEIERRKKLKGKEYFRYEHPDLVREGIVFEG